MERRGEKRWSRDIITTLSLSLNAFFTPPNPFNAPPSSPHARAPHPAPLLQTHSFPSLSPPPPPGSHQPHRFPLERAKPPPLAILPSHPMLGPYAQCPIVLNLPFPPTNFSPSLPFHTSLLSYLPHPISLQAPFPSIYSVSPSPFPLFPHPHPTTQSTPRPLLYPSPEVSVMVRSWRVFFREGKERREGKGRGAGADGGQGSCNRSTASGVKANNYSNETVGCTPESPAAKKLAACRFTTVEAAPARPS